LEIDDALLDSLDQLQVIGVCGCGCASINFREGAREDSSTLLCDGIGTTPSGGGVGVIVWGVRDAITSLEVYDLGAGEDDISLPLPDSVRAWGPTERGGGG
jgi:hypothetical protein